ncbi:MAG: flavin reductase family protein [Dehalococcoidia bacterium]|nr:flavin reductase family protein [Dehalococcoidia bacterium]
MPEVSPDDFKGALGSWASGVTVVTTKLDGMVYGITVSSFASLSIDPLLITVSLADSNHLPGMIKQSKQFAVSILAADQQDVSAYFARAGRDPQPGFETPVKAKPWHTGSPIIEGAIAHLDCNLEQAFQGGDHTIVVGRVAGAAFDPSKQPLVYFRRAYRSVSEVLYGG